MNAAIRLSLLATVAAMSLALSSAPSQAADCELKLGMVGPLSGAATAWGVAVRSGVEFVAAEANKAGGLPVGSQKCNVTVTAYDSKYTADGAAAGANFLASQNVKFIIGPIGSPEATGIKPVAQRNGQITFNSAYAKNAIEPQYPLAFHQLSGPATWAPPLAKAAKEKFGFKSIVCVAPNDQGGTDIASVDAEAYRAVGVKASEEYYQRGTTNFAPIIQRILSQNPDAVDTASSPPGDGATIAKQLREAGFTGVIGRLGGPGTAEIIRAVGGVDKLGNFYWLEVVATDDPNVKAIWDEYKAVMGQPAPDNTLMITGLAAARMTLKAITKAGTIDDVNKVAEALRTLPVEDKNLGKGEWTGQKIYGINQELSFSVGMGIIADGKNLGVTKIDTSAAR
jgi:branched-chain amino acid transport system substrate-binding protein